MIVTYPLGAMGQLGNQLFQVVATVGIAQDHGAVPLFPGDRLCSVLRLPRTWFSRQPELFRDAIDVRGLARHDLNDVLMYLQDPAFWGGNQQFAKNLVKPSPEVALLADEKSRCLNLDFNGVAIHVRRGDYLHDPDKFVVPTLDYYTAALMQLGDSSRRVAIFSDDEAWSESTLVRHLQAHGFRALVVPFGLAVVDMFLMARFRSIIMAPSSFSWWAAYLSDANVVAPTPWFRNGVGHDGSHLVQESWIRMMCS